MIYAQVINGMVNLIGGEEVGLPVLNHPLVTCIDITDIPEEERPKVGWYYIDECFSETPPFVPEPNPDPTPQPISIADQLEDLKEQNLILMDALATIFEEILLLEGS